jgi:hypothetical protein
MSRNKTLSDLPDILPDLKILTVHGRGRGGGEKVASNIKSIFALHGLSIQVVPTEDGEKILRTLNKNRKTVKTTNQNIKVLFTSGPRDIPLIILSILYRISFSVYIQVPYTEAITWKDPIHAASVKIYLYLTSKFASLIVSNSKKSAAGCTNDPTVVLPIRTTPILEKNESIPSDIDQEDYTINLVTACRLFPERGVGSRDIHALKRLLSECLNYQSTHGRPVLVKIYGDIDPCYKEIFFKFKDILKLEGYDENWMHKERGPFFFFSTYEGFGLAAYEAASLGKQVFVNDAFPSELKSARPEINFIDTSRKDREILSQIIK